jgi:hypothetical protein
MAKANTPYPQLANFFVRLSLQRGTLTIRPRTIRPRTMRPRTKRPLDDPSPGRSVSWTIRPLDDLSPGWSVPWTNRPRDKASLWGRTIRPWFFSRNGRNVPDFLGTFCPFGICTADITTRAASLTKACVHTLQQRRFATFPMRDGLLQKSRGRIVTGTDRSGTHCQGTFKGLKTNRNCEMNYSAVAFLFSFYILFKLMTRVGINY